MGAWREQADAGTVRIPAGEATLEGDLELPHVANAIVLFAHGSGSSRHSPRNRLVARALRENGLGTLLFDLLTADEEAADRRIGHLRFDIALLAKRLDAATEWARRQAGDLAVGYFGASTGAAAALVAASECPDGVRAVVSRGGRPDLAGAALGRVRAPTLLIVGGADVQVLGLNQRALEHLKCEKKLKIVRDATHLFEEPGALEQVAVLATQLVYPETYGIVSNTSAAYTLLAADVR